MELEEFYEKVDEFLAENGYDLDLIVSNKDKLEALRNIALVSENDMIVLEQRFTSNRVKSDIDSDKSCYGGEFDDYVNSINDLEFNVQSARYYISNVKGIIRKENKKEFHRKVKSLFRK